MTGTRSFQPSNKTIDTLTRREWNPKNTVLTAICFDAHRLITEDEEEEVMNKMVECFHANLHHYERDAEMITHATWAHPQDRHNRLLKWDMAAACGRLTPPEPKRPKQRRGKRQRA